MLEFMRKNAKFFYVFFFLIIISFIFFYAKVPGGNYNDPVLATVDGFKIKLSEYWRAYENLREYYRSIYQDKFTEDMEKKLDLKKKTLDALIEDRLLLKKALDLGLTVTDRELEEAIISNPLFQKDGVFRRDIYENTLRANRLTPAEYEGAKRRELLLQKVRSLITDAVTITEEDLKGIQADEKVIDQIKEAILASKKQAFYKSYIQGLKKETEIKINWDLIKS
ncbi:MAG: hypothetical protein D6778_10615 [Nitrospirae bacterium]|nr:MAG: hypothetical protein D6778_10615 [Nitrospirota bacterium]